MQSAIAPRAEREVPETWKTAKRAMDVGLGSVLLLLSAPVVAVAAIGIVCVTGGSPWFAQERVGMHGRRFKMYKLRTMVRGAEEMRDGILHLNEVGRPGL